MKEIIALFILSTALVSCNNNRKDQYSIDGKWQFMNEKKGSELVFKNGFYSQIKWDDDLVIKSKGNYYVNINPKRAKLIISLIPDLQYSEGDTIRLPCENIDVISLTDSIMIIQQPTQWIHRKDNQSIVKNKIIKFKKVQMPGR